jgi:hypothetical protein
MASSIERVAKSCTNLSSLNISGVESITDHTIKVISQRYPLFSLPSYSYSQTYRCTHMHNLILGHCPNVTDAAVNFIANKLAGAIQILTINNGVKITDASVTVLGNACSSLRYDKMKRIFFFFFFFFRNRKSKLVFSKAYSNTLQFRTLKLRNSSVSHNSVIGLIQNNTMLSRLDLFGSHQLGGPIFDCIPLSFLAFCLFLFCFCFDDSSPSYEWPGY